MIEDMFGVKEREGMSTVPLAVEMGVVVMVVVRFTVAADTCPFTAATMKTTTAATIVVVLYFFVYCCSNRTRTRSFFVALTQPTTVLLQ